MRYCPRCDNTRWFHLDRPFLGGRACGCGGAGAPCPVCNKTNPADPDDVPAMPAGFTSDLGTFRALRGWNKPRWSGIQRGKARR